MLKAFKMFDRDKDGFISTQELKKVATMLGTMLTKEEVEDFMAEADMVSLSVMVISTVLKYLSNIQDGNGQLDYDEFVKMLLQS